MNTKTPQYCFTQQGTIYIEVIELQWFFYIFYKAFNLGNSVDISVKLGKINFIVNKFKNISNIIYIFFILHILFSLTFTYFQSFYLNQHSHISLLSLKYIIHIECLNFSILRFRFLLLLYWEKCKRNWGINGQCLGGERVYIRTQIGP